MSKLALVFACLFLMVAIGDCYLYMVNLKFDKFRFQPVNGTMNIIVAKRDKTNVPIKLVDRKADDERLKYHFIERDFDFEIEEVTGLKFLFESEDTTTPVNLISAGLLPNYKGDKGQMEKFVKIFCPNEAIVGNKKIGMHRCMEAFYSNEVAFTKA